MSVERTTPRFRIRKDLLDQLARLAEQAKRTAPNLLEGIMEQAFAQPDLLQRLKVKKKGPTLGDIVGGLYDTARTLRSKSGHSNDVETPQ